MSRARLVELPEFRVPAKPGALIVSHAADVTGGLFAAAPRVYWLVNDTEAPTRRGGHYHPEGGKQEYMVCLSGKATIELHDAQGGCEQIELTGPRNALYIPCGVWHALTLSPGAILLAVASTRFAKDEAPTEMPCSCNPPW